MSIDQTEIINLIRMEISTGLNTGGESPKGCAEKIIKKLDESGFVIVTKKTMQIYHEDQSEKEDMSCDNTM